jgi:uncharacterized protein HemX
MKPDAADMSQGEHNMPTRHRATDDTGPAPLDPTSSTHAVKIVREIPMWGVIGGLAALGAQAVALYYGQQRMVEQMTEVRAEVRSLTSASNTRERDTIELRSDLRALTTRVDDSARRLEDQGRRLAEIERRVKP